MKKLCFSDKTEQKVKVPIPGTELHINGILRGDWTQPVAILMHGLPGSNTNTLPFLSAKYLNENGIATLRINMYDDEVDTRDMVDCILQTHADDFDTVVDYVRKKKPPKIFAAGHSYGGLTILISKSKLDSAVLWDPSHFKCSFEYDNKRNDMRHFLIHETGVTAYLFGHGHLDPVTMAEERVKFMNISEENIAKKPYPILFLAAGEGALLPYLKKYFEAANEPKKLKVIKNATHSLADTDRILFETLEQTGNWFSKYS